MQVIILGQGKCGSVLFSRKVKTLGLRLSDPSIENALREARGIRNVTVVRAIADMTVKKEG